MPFANKLVKDPPLSLRTPKQDESHSSILICVSVSMLTLRRTIMMLNSMQNSSNIYAAAATYGLLFGGYWVVKYIFLMCAFSAPLLGLLYLPLTLAVPFVAYYLGKRYRDHRDDRRISFAQAWLFGSLLYFFAAILVSLPHFYFYQTILPQHMPVMLEQMEEVLRPVIDPNTWDQMKYALTATEPIKRVVNDLWSNVVWGVIFSLPVAAILRRN